MISAESAFVCHNENHWFAVRKVHDVWLNLNSTSTWGPQIISDFYLDGFLDAVQDSGYTVFVVRGEFPALDPDLFAGSLNLHQRFVSLADVRARYEQEVKAKTYKLNTGGSDQWEIEAAIKASLAQFQTDEQHRKTSQSPLPGPDNSKSAKCRVIRYRRG